MRGVGNLEVEVNDTEKNLLPRDLLARCAKYPRRPRRVASERSRRSAILPEDVLRAGGSQLVATGRGHGRNELRPSRCTRGLDVYEFPFPSRLSDCLKDNRRFRMLTCWALGRVNVRGGGPSSCAVEKCERTRQARPSCFVPTLILSYTIMYFPLSCGLTA